MDLLLLVAVAVVVVSITTRRESVDGNESHRRSQDVSMEIRSTVRNRVLRTRCGGSLAGTNSKKRSVVSVIT